MLFEVTIITVIMVAAIVIAVTKTNSNFMTIMMMRLYFVAFDHVTAIVVVAKLIKKES